MLTDRIKNNSMKFIKSMSNKVKNCGISKIKDNQKNLVIETEKFTKNVA